MSKEDSAPMTTFEITLHFVWWAESAEADWNHIPALQSSLWDAVIPKSWHTR